MHYYMDDGSGSSWWWMLPAMLVFLVAVGAVVWAVLAATRPHGSAAPQQIAPEEVLAHRLQAGLGDNDNGGAVRPVSFYVP